MAEQIIDVPGQGPVSFPDSMSDADIAAAIKKMTAPTLLQSRQQASKSEFESNLPESTVATRAREAARGILEPFDLHNVPGLLSAVGGALSDVVTGKGTSKAQDLVKNAALMIERPVQNFAEGIQEGDYDKAAYGAGGMLSQTAPAVASAVGAVKGALPMASPEMAADIYKTALKAPTTMPVEDVKAIVDTALKNEIPISEEGVQKLNSLVRDLNNAIDAKVKGAPGNISPTDVATRLDKTKAFMKQQALPESDMASVDAAKEEFMRQHQTPGSPAVPSQPTGVLDANGNPIMTASKPAVPAKDIPISPEDAQSLKKGTYARLSGKYGELSSASMEAQKALARGLKEELANQIPELTELNAKEGALLDLNPVLERAVNRAANANKGRIGPMLAGGVVKALTGNTAVATASSILKAVLDDPETASKLAMAIDRAQRANPAKYGAPNISTTWGRIRALSQKLGTVSASAAASRGATTTSDSSGTP